MLLPSVTSGEIEEVRVGGMLRLYGHREAQGSAEFTEIRCGALNIGTIRITKCKKNSQRTLSSAKPSLSFSSCEQSVLPKIFFPTNVLVFAGLDIHFLNCCCLVGKSECLPQEVKVCQEIKTIKAPA